MADTPAADAWAEQTVSLPASQGSGPEEGRQPQDGTPHYFTGYPDNNHAAVDATTTGASFPLKRTLKTSLWRPTYGAVMTPKEPIQLSQ